MSELILHVGVMKTGTTYLQNILSQNRAELYDNGWLYPGELLNQQHACYGICGSAIPWIRDGRKYERLGQQLEASVRGANRHVVLSSEALSTLDEEAIAHFLEHVGRPTRVIFTIRPLWQLIPSAWQQRLKTGLPISQDDFIQHRFVGQWDNENASTVRTYAYGRAIRRWAKVSGCQVNTIESLPSNEPKDTLWLRFKEAAHLPGISATKVKGTGENQSIPYDAAEVLRRVNRLTAGQKNRDRMRKAYLTKILFPLATQKIGKKPALPANFSALVDEWNAQELDIARDYSEIVTIGDTVGRNAPASTAGDSDPSEIYEQLAMQIAKMLPYLERS